MKSRSVYTALAIVSVSASVADQRAWAAEGPDVIIGSVDAAQFYGQVDGVAAFAIGFAPCNIGSVAAAWMASTSNHPVVAQNLYRIKDGRFEHIGMSWAWHEFCALQMNACANSPDYPGSCVPGGAGCTGSLGTGCSTVTSASSAGQQQFLGPRSQISAFTGAFAFPFAAAAAPATIGRRLQVPVSDVDPALNAGAVWLAELHIVSPDDAQAGNHHNNASHRRVIPGAGGASMALSGLTQRRRPAVAGWQDVDPAVTLVNVDVPGEGRFHVAANVVDRGGGIWEYIYVVHNLNSDLGCGSVLVPVGCGAEVTSPGFSAPRTHSGEPYSNDAWPATVQPGGISWSAEAESVDPDANAIRWGTAYTFWFRANAPPEVDAAGDFTGAVTLGLFRGGAGVVVAQGLPAPAAACRADWNQDQVITSTDISAFITDWLSAVMSGDLNADVNCDGHINSADISSFIGSWLAAMTGQGC